MTKTEMEARIDDIEIEYSAARVQFDRDIKDRMKPVCEEFDPRASKIGDLYDEIEELKHKIKAGEFDPEPETTKE